jgi:hypothetical protein
MSLIVFRNIFGLGFGFSLVLHVVLLFSFFYHIGSKYKGRNLIMFGTYEEREDHLETASVAKDIFGEGSKLKTFIAPQLKSIVEQEMTGEVMTNFSGLNPFMRNDNRFS